VTIVGDTQKFTGSGLRFGGRCAKACWLLGHAWQSALFPSGKAFGYIAYPPRPDGQPTFNEGYIFTGNGDLIPRAPRRRHGSPGYRHSARTYRWFSRLPTAACTSRRDGVLHHDIHHNDETFSVRAMKQENSNFPALQQAGVRYRWTASNLRHARALQPPREDQPRRQSR